MYEMINKDEMLKQILPSCNIRNMENSGENMHVDISAEPWNGRSLSSGRRIPYIYNICYFQRGRYSWELLEGSENECYFWEAITSAIHCFNGTLHHWKK